MSLLKKYWFLVALVTLLVTGYFTSSTFAWLSELAWLKWSIVGVTMFLMAWPLSFDQIKSAIASPGPTSLATTLNLVAIPLLVWPFAWMAGPELGPGLLIAAATPSTLASAAVWTRRAQGNDGISIMVTIITNASCFLVLPLWIYVQTGDQVDSKALLATTYNLLFFVVIPIGLGQLARLRRPWAEWATQNKPRLSLVALIGLLSIVFLGAVKMGIRFSNATELTDALSFSNLGITWIVVLLVHVVVFWGGIWIAGQLGFRREDQIAVGFSGSQKTLMVGLSTAITLGFSMIPIVMYHTTQLIVDAYFAEQLRSKPESHDTPSP